MSYFSELDASMQDASEADGQLCFEFYDPGYADLDFVQYFADFGAIVRWENEMKRRGLLNYEIAQLEV